MHEEETQAVLVRETKNKTQENALRAAAELGYGSEDLALLPEGIDVLEGCGNPLAAQR